LNRIALRIRDASAFASCLAPRTAGAYAVQCASRFFKLSSLSCHW